MCEAPRGMCSSFASYAHPGKEEVHRHTSCGGGGFWGWLTVKAFKGWGLRCLWGKQGSNLCHTTSNLLTWFFLNWNQSYGKKCMKELMWQRLTETLKRRLNTHVCSTESVDEGLSFSSGGLWSNTMVSVLARQNPLDRMISEKGTEFSIGSAVRSSQHQQRRHLRVTKECWFHVPDILIGLWKHGWILWTLSFLSTWSSGDRSKKVNITSDLEYCRATVFSH